MTKHEERDWISKLKKGDLSILNTIIDAYGDKMKRTAFFLTGDTALSEDCVQDMFISFYFNLHQFREESSIGTYLYRILVNACRQKTRNPWFKRVTPVNEITESSGSTQIEDTTIVRMAIHKSLLRVVPKYREVLTLFYFNRFTVEEISSILNINSNTVKTRLKRGREQLKPYLEKEGFGNGLQENV